MHVLLLLLIEVVAHSRPAVLSLYFLEISGEPHLGLTADVVQPLLRGSRLHLCRRLSSACL